MDKEFHPTLHQACDYLTMLGLKLIHVSNRMDVYSATDALLLKHQAMSIHSAD